MSLYSFFIFSAASGHMKISHLLFFVNCNLYEKENLCMCIALIFASFLWNSVLHSMDMAFDSIAMRLLGTVSVNIFKSIWKKKISINV